MNRGIARRTLFETGEDVQVFADGLAAASERGLLEVHAFTFLTTHFHLLVRSPAGRLSEGLHAVQLRFARSFNRRRRRDGSLFRGRFGSKHVASLRYRRVLVGYIDANARRAGLVERAAAYRHGSCRAYVTGDGPAWLHRSWVEGDVCEALGLPRFDGARYGEAFPEGGDAQAELVEARMAGRWERHDPLDSLLDGAAPAVLDWMRRKAALADGTAPGVALVGSIGARRCLALLDAEAIGRAFLRRRIRLEPMPSMNVWLQRVVAARPLAEIAREAGVGATAVRRRFDAAGRVLFADPEIAARVAAAVAAVLAETYGRRAGGGS